MNIGKAFKGVFSNFHVASSRRTMDVEESSWSQSIDVGTSEMTIKQWGRLHGASEVTRADARNLVLDHR